MRRRLSPSIELPFDYRSSFLTGEQGEALGLFIDGLYDSGVVTIHTGVGTMSTPMTEVEVDLPAKAVGCSLVRVRDAGFRLELDRRALA